MTLYLTPGNHEDYGQLAALTADGPSGLPWLTDNIAILPRGHRWVMGGRTFVSLGGAPSLDYQSRIEGKDWWPAEAVTADDVRRVISGGHADVMLTHDAPLPGTPAVERIIARNPMGWTNRARAYAATGRELMTPAFATVQPTLLVHGHFHGRDEAVVTFPGSAIQCQVLSLNTAGKPGNLAVLDLTTDPLSWEWAT